MVNELNSEQAIRIPLTTETDLSEIATARKIAVAHNIDYVEKDIGPLAPIVDWLMTENCNRRCVGCWLNCSPWAPPTKLTLSEHKFLIDELYKRGVRSIGPSGGEPLTIENISGILAYCKTKQGLQVNFYTNGILLENNFSSIVPFVDLLSLSLDGSSGLRNASLRGGEASDFDCIIRSIQKIKLLEKRPVLQVISVVSRENIDDIENIGRVLEKETRGITNFQWKINLNFSFGRGKALVPELKYAEFESLAKKIQQKFPLMKINYSPPLNTDGFLDLDQEGNLIAYVDAEVVVLGNLFTGKYLKNAEAIMRRIITAQHKKAVHIGRLDLVEKIEHPVISPDINTNRDAPKTELKLVSLTTPDSERIHATNFQDTMTYIQTQPQAQPLIVALGTSWIKGYEKGRYLQYDALNPLLVSLRTYCEQKGIPFILDSDDKLLARINAERAKDGRSGAKVVVLAGKDAVASDEFTTLRNDQKNAFVVGVDNQELTTDSYIRLMEMLTLALKLSAGLEISLDNIHITITKDNERHLYIFLPHAEPMEYERLKVIYEAQKFA